MKIILFISITFFLIQCGNRITVHKNCDHVHITDTAIGTFKKSTLISEYDLNKYQSAIDTTCLSSEEDTIPMLGKKIFIDNNNFICLWLWNDTIIEIQTNSPLYYTKDSISINTPILSFLTKIENEEYFVDYESELSFFLPERKLIISFSNSGYLTEDEINQIHKKKNIKASDKLSEIKICYIRLISLNE